MGQPRGTLVEYGPEFLAACPSTVSHAGIDRAVLRRHATREEGYEMRPHRISDQCGLLSILRMTGTFCVGATLKLGGNVHSLRTRLNSCSIEASSVTHSGRTWINSLTAPVR
jgi:hypothetical protein